MSESQSIRQRRYRQKLKTNPERLAEHNKQRREKRKKIAETNPERYAEYLARKRLDSKAYSANNRERERRRKKEWRQRNLEKDLQSKRDDRRNLRQKVILAYGGKCVCCGESRFEFLGIDHIGGGGNQHRKSIKCELYSWLVKEHFPSAFRLLCHNCNQSLGHYGYCPHKLKKEGE